MPPTLRNRYFTPVYFLGARVICEVRGVVEIVGLSNSAHPWPVGEQDGKLDLIVYRGLAKAVREELPDAVAARWGVNVEAVEAWKAHLDMPQVVESRKPITRRRRVSCQPHKHKWMPEEDEIVRTTPTMEAAKILGVSKSLLGRRRMQLHVGLHHLLQH